MDFHLVPVEERPGPLKTPRYLDTERSIGADSISQVHERSFEFVYLTGATSADRELSVAITRRPQMAWACFQWCKTEIYDRLDVRIPLKVWMLKAKVIETLLYGCLTWSPNKPD